MDVFWTLPPVTRTITAAAVVVSALGYAGVISLELFTFELPLIFTVPPQVWRIVTAFFITRPKMAIVFDPYSCASSKALHQLLPLTTTSIPVW